ncbi:MAG: hypothetical protein IJW62_05290 [Clostridia bacterium]|nr:hypothetical protein [Clostridia bacterium]
MNDLYTILQTHAARYSKMEPTDAVKLLYQSEFGGGHLIANEDACLAYLRAEWARTPFDPQAPLLEDIGGGVVRVMLAAIAEAAEIEVLGRDFIASAANVHGTNEGFLEKLAILRKMTAEGCFAFSLGELDEYLAAYEKAGYPVVSHSETYRMHYRPAYRVLRSKDCSGILAKP